MQERVSHRETSKKGPRGCYCLISSRLITKPAPLTCHASPPGPVSFASIGDVPFRDRNEISGTHANRLRLDQRILLQHQADAALVLPSSSGCGGSTSIWLTTNDDGLKRPISSAVGSVTGNPRRSGGGSPSNQVLPLPDQRRLRLRALGGDDEDIAHSEMAPQHLNPERRERVLQEDFEPSAYHRRLVEQW